MQQRRFQDKRSSNYKGKRSTSSSYSGYSNHSGSSGSSAQKYEKAKLMRFKYLDKAKDALAMGDRVSAENYFQYADHYTRIMEGDGNFSSPTQPSIAESNTLENEENSFNSDNSENY